MADTAEIESQNNQVNNNNNNNTNNSKTVESWNKKKPTTAEKRKFIKQQIETSFPGVTLFYYAHVFIGFGVTAIVLQSILIANKAPLSRIGNGIWGGCFAILNGVIKLILLKKKSYSAFVFYQTMTFLVAIATSIGLVGITGICISRYPCSEMPSCSLRNHVITIVLHVVGILAVLKNLISVFAINIQLMGNCRNILRYRLGFCEAYKELFSTEVY